jgi:hypothetical protein
VGATILSEAIDANPNSAEIEPHLYAVVVVVVVIIIIM